MYKPVKGMQDLLPEEKASKEAIEKVLRNVVQRAGFQEIETPVMERVQLLTKKSGEDIKKQLFLLQKKSTEELGLRFDLTIPMTRLFISQQKSLQKPVKWFSIGRNWRYEAPQQGRSREFYQLSVEVFGSSKTQADAEVITLTIDCLKALGLQEKDFRVKINNRKLLEGLLLPFVEKKNITNVFRVIDKVNKITEDEFKKELVKAGIKKKNIENIQTIVGFVGKPSFILPLIQGVLLKKEAAEGYKELEEIFSYLKDKNIVVDLSIARGLGYYTGTVFEIEDTEGKYRALCGGGRYDGLVKQFGGQDTGATGFGIGLSNSVLPIFLKEKGLLPLIDASPEYFIGVTDKKYFSVALQLARKLRKKTTTVVEVMDRKVRKQLQYANYLGAKKLIIIGEEEVTKKVVKVQNLQTRKEKKMKLNYL